MSSRVHSGGPRTGHRRGQFRGHCRGGLYGIVEFIVGCIVLGSRGPSRGQFRVHWGHGRVRDDQGAV